MAYNFIAENAQYTLSPFSSIAFYPTTFSAWVYATDDTLAMTIVSWNQPTGSAGFRTLLAGQATNDPVRGVLGVSTFSQISPGFTINTWHHICFVCASSVSRTVYRDGVAGNTNTTNSTPFNLTRFWIGTSAGASYFKGHISDVAIWSAALNTDEINSLAKGFSAKRIRPQSLEYYVPLVRNLYEYNSNISVTSTEISGGSAPTVTTHNRIYL